MWQRTHNHCAKTAASVLKPRDNQRPGFDPAWRSSSVVTRTLNGASAAADLGETTPNVSSAAVGGNTRKRAFSSPEFLRLQ